MDCLFQTGRLPPRRQPRDALSLLVDGKNLLPLSDLAAALHDTQGPRVGPMSSCSAISTPCSFNLFSHGGPPIGGKTRSRRSRARLHVRLIKFGPNIAEIGGKAVPIVHPDFLALGLLTV